MIFEIDTFLNGHQYIFRADSKDDLISAIYKSGEEGKLDAHIAIMLTDIVEVVYGDDEPGLFSWTEGFKKLN